MEVPSVQNYLRTSRKNFILITLTAVVIAVLIDGIKNAEPELFMDTADLIRRHSYPVETHKVVTSDGYVLTLHRIPNRINTTDDDVRRPPVLLQHGIMCSSDSWVLRGPNKDLAFMLSDAGFDVWLGNSRGNDYSNGHISLTVNSPEYWEFSWHEMGYYDLPATIDYILTTTNQTKINYIGYSMGTTMFFVMCSTKPEYNNKINHMVGLAPAAILYHISYFQSFGINFLYMVNGLSTLLLGRYQVLPRTDFRSYAFYTVCRDSMPLTQMICREIGFAIAGRSIDYNNTLIPNIYAHVPASISVFTLKHFLQNIKADKFQQFDHGLFGNLEKYNQTQPPEYDLKKVTVPISLHYSQNDILTYSQAVISLSNVLPNVTNIRKVPVEDFNHFDFMWGSNANRLLYDNVLSTLLHFS